MGIFDNDTDDDFNLEEIQARQDALEAELAGRMPEWEAEVSLAAETETQMKTVAEPDAEADAEPDAEAKAKSEAEAEAEASADAKTDVEAGTQTKTAAGAEDENADSCALAAGGQNEDLPTEEAAESEESLWEAVIEAVLFTMGNAVELNQLAVAIGQDKKAARAAVENLRERYDRDNSGMEIIRLEDSYQMRTRGKYYENLIRVASAPRKHVLTDVVLETLSIIAYRQPVTRLEIEKIRGVKSDHAVNKLIEYDLVQEVGRLDAPGRPALFATTDEFLRRFGIGSRSELPDMDPVRLDELRSQVEEELQSEPGGMNGEDGN